MAVNAEHSLLHALPRVAAALVHAGPQAREGTDHRAALASHRREVAQGGLENVAVRAV